MGSSSKCRPTNRRGSPTWPPPAGGSTAATSHPMRPSTCTRAPRSRPVPSRRNRQRHTCSTSSAVCTPGRSHPLPRRSLVVGRAPNCDIVLDDPTVSPQHATIDEHHRVCDLGSVNGTRIQGDLICFGATQARIRPRRADTRRPGPFNRPPRPPVPQPEPPPAEPAAPEPRARTRHRGDRRPCAHGRRARHRVRRPAVRAPRTDRSSGRTDDRRGREACVQATTQTTSTGVAGPCASCSSTANGSVSGSRRSRRIRAS